MEHGQSHPKWETKYISDTQLSRLHHTKAGRIKRCQGEVKYGVFVESKLQGPQVV